MAISNEIEKLERRWQQTSGLVFAPLAEAYRKAGMHQRALEVLEQGLALHPEYGPALIVRGRCHLDSGNLEKAEVAFEQALARDPMDPIAIRGIADVFARTNRIPEALERLQLLVDLDPRNAEARAALGRLQQYVVPEPTFTPEPEPTDESYAAPAAAVVPEPTPFPEPPAIEPIPLEPAELAPLPDLPTAQAPEETPVSPVSSPVAEPAEFRIESFAVEPLEVPTELRSNPPVDSLAPISWTPAPVDEIEEPAVGEPESPSASEVVFTPAGESLAAPESRPAEAPVPEAWSEPAPGREPEEPVGSEVPLDSVLEPWEQPAESSLVEFSAPLATSYDEELVDADEPVAEQPVAEYASDMPLPDEPVPFGDEAIAQAPEVDLVEAAPERQMDAPVADEAVAPAVDHAVVPDADESVPTAADDAVAPAADSVESMGEPVPVLIVTESMAELFLRQGHRELALAVYRQLTVRGPVSPRLSDAIERIEAELSARAVSPEMKPAYAARVTGGKSVEQLLQGVLRAVPPAPASSVLPPAIEPAAGEPTRAASDTLPLSAVFGDEPVVAPRPEPTAAEPETSFDEFFGAVPSPEPAATGGNERSAESEDLRQFNEWLKGLKR